MIVILNPKEPVAREFIGLARQLRYRVAESAIPARFRMDQLIEPLRPKPGFQPYPKHTLLKHICKQWERLPSFGRLEHFARFEDGKLRLADLRATPTKLRYKNWADDDWEEGISVCQTLVICKPPNFAHEQRDLCAVSLHAAARYYQRASVKSDDAILKDLHPLANFTLEQNTEFTISVNGGNWVGEGLNINSKVVLLARSFL